MTDDDIRDRHDIEAGDRCDEPDPDGWADACTLNDSEETQRRRWMETTLFPHLREFERVEDGITATFEPTDDALAAVTTLVRYETRCCPFATFELTVPGNDGPIRLAMTGPGSPDDVLADEFFREVLEETP